MMGAMLDCCPLYLEHPMGTSMTHYTSKKKREEVYDMWAVIMPIANNSNDGMRRFYCGRILCITH